MEEFGEQDGDGEVEVVVEAGGRYLTPAHLATILQTQEDLKIHMDAHKLTTQAPPAPAPTERPTTSKPANLEWPRLEMDMTDPEWSLFMAEWARYCKSCKLTDEQEKVDQL